jgi:hypothetical protein
MLTSSIKIAIASFGRAPNKVFPFLFNFDSIANWVSFGLVLAEKFKKIVMTLCYLLEKRKGTAKEVFPTPESPVISMGFLVSSRISKICLYFKVSMVGTIMSWYYAPFGN